MSLKQLCVGKDVKKKVLSNCTYYLTEDIEPGTIYLVTSIRLVPVIEDIKIDLTIEVDGAKIVDIDSAV